jgi:hypothetical protein
LDHVQVDRRLVSYFVKDTLKAAVVQKIRVFVVAIAEENIYIYIYMGRFQIRGVLL